MKREQSEMELEEIARERATTWLPGPSQVEIDLCEPIQTPANLLFSNTDTQHLH